jgi:F-type H+-transporting ATPase subunit b
MLIDGFTIVAQMVNFLVLVLLLQRFLYGPVVRAMEERETRIAKAVAKSEMAEKEARRRADELAAQQQAFLDGKAKLLTDARTEIEQWRKEKIERLLMEIDVLRRSWLDQVDHDRQVFLMKLKTDAVRHVMPLGKRSSGIWPTSRWNRASFLC